MKLSQYQYNIVGRKLLSDLISDLGYRDVIRINKLIWVFSGK